MTLFDQNFKYGPHGVRASYPTLNILYHTSANKPSLNLQNSGKSVNLFMFEAEKIYVIILCVGPKFCPLQQLGPKC